MNSCCFAVSCLLFFLPVGSGFSIQTRLAVGYDQGVPSLVQPVEIDRYTDMEKGFTALKDKKFKSCFIKEFDPFWNPKETDKEEIMRNIEYETIDSDQEAYVLRKKTGAVIADMCRPVRIFWATTPAPPPLLIHQTGSGNMAPPPIPINRDSPPVGIPIGENNKLPIEIQDIIRESQNQPSVGQPKINPELVNGVEEIKTPPPLEIYRQNHSVDIAEVPPPIIREKEEESLIPPPINTEKDEILAPPPPLMLKPNPVSNMDEFQAPPPLDVWRRMLANIKRTTTLEPPTPDMRAPDFKPGMFEPPKIDQLPLNMRVPSQINLHSSRRQGGPVMVPPPRIEPRPQLKINEIEVPLPEN